jgi:hypothetical protein
MSQPPWHNPVSRVTEEYKLWNSCVVEFFPFSCHIIFLLPTNWLKNVIWTSSYRNEGNKLTTKNSHCSTFNLFSSFSAIPDCTSMYSSCKSVRAANALRGLRDDTAFRWSLTVRFCINLPTKQMSEHILTETPWKITVCDFIKVTSLPTVALKVKQVPVPHYTLSLLTMGYKWTWNM